MTDEEERKCAARELKAELEAADPEPTEGENASFGAEFFRGGMEASAAMTAAESADRVAAADSEWERAVDIIAVEHMQRVERLQRISAARELQAGLMAAEQQITATAQLRNALERAEERCSEMEGQPGLQMEGQLAQEIQLPVGMFSDAELLDDTILRAGFRLMDKEDAAAELKTALEDAEAWLREQQRMRRPVAMPIRRQAIAVSAESRVATGGLGAAAEHSEQDEDTEASALALVVQIAGQSVIAGFDTWAETSVVRRSLTTPDVKVTKVEAQVFAGVGGTKQLDELARVPVQMRYGADVVYVMARVMDDGDMPDYVGLLFGTEAQDGMRAVYDCDDRRLELRTLGVVIDLEEADVLVSRMMFEPLRVLELCARMSGSYGIMIDLGYWIEVWDAVESDSDVAAVAMAAYPKLKHAREDVCAFMLEGR